jgi:hypothetical protein
MDFREDIWELNVSNPCVTGFIVEHVVLSSIALNGLNITPAINHAMEVVALFGRDIPSFDVTRDGRAEGVQFGG